MYIDDVLSPEEDDAAAGACKLLNILFGALRGYQCISNALQSKAFQDEHERKTWRSTGLFAKVFTKATFNTN